jgi:two-component system, response regulator
MRNVNCEFPEVVVVIDDDENDQLLLRRLLRKTGMESEVVIFSDGKEAIQALPLLEGKAGSMAILLDAKMPFADGFAVLRWVRGQTAFNATPVMMLSSSDQPSDVLQAKREGAQCYMVKYPPHAALREALRDARRYAVTPELERSVLFADKDNRMRS